MMRASFVEHRQNLKAARSNPGGFFVGTVQL